MKPTRRRLNILHPGLHIAPDPQVAGHAAVAEREGDDDVVSVRSQALRTPLDTLVAFADLVAADDVTEEQRQLYAARLRLESRRLTDLIDNAVELQRLEAGRRDLDYAPVDVRSLIRRAQLAAGEDKRLPIKILAPDQLPLVWADAEAILEVLGRFLENARRFSPGGGAIEVEARLAGDMVEISIRDHGIGLAPTELPKVFRKFYRADSSLRMVRRGAGLGLAINRAIVESHGGQIAATSAGPGKGAQFQFTLPLAREVAKPGYVLIVDGDPAFARLLKLEFATAGLDTVRASDAETAQQILADGTPSAIVLDLSPAGLSAEGFLARLRAVPGTHLPVVALAARDLLATEISALEKWGILAMLPKEAGAPQAAAALVAKAMTRGGIES